MDRRGHANGQLSAVFALQIWINGISFWRVQMYFVEMLTLAIKRDSIRIFLDLLGIDRDEMDLEADCVWKTNAVCGVS